MLQYASCEDLTSSTCIFLYCSILNVFMSIFLLTGITLASQRNHYSKITIRYANVRLVFAWQDLYMNGLSPSETDGAVIWLSFLYLRDTAGTLSATQRRSPIRVTVNCHSLSNHITGQQETRRRGGEETVLR